MGFLKAFKSAATPHIAKGQLETIVDAVTMSASNAWVYSEPIDVRAARNLNLYVDYNPAAAAGQITLGILVTPDANGGDAPDADDVTWYWMTEVASGVPGVLLGAVPASAAWTIAPDFSVRVARAMAITNEPADAAANQQPIKVSLDVSGDFWVRVAFQETGAAAVGAATIKSNLST